MRDFSPRADGHSRQVNIAGNSSGDINFNTSFHIFPGRNGFRLSRKAAGALIVFVLLITATSVLIVRERSEEERQAELAEVTEPPGPSTWLPDRETFTMHPLASDVVLNSVVDNPEYGDERNFMRIRPYGQDAEWSDLAVIEPGRTYEVSVYYRNDSSKYAISGSLRVEIPAVIQPEASAAGDFALARISASNANPGEVIDSVHFENRTSGAMELRRVPGSVKLKPSGESTSISLDDDGLYSADGTPIGQQGRNGFLSGGDSGRLTFHLVAEQPDFRFSTKVRQLGDEEWKPGVLAANGTHIQLLLEYSNTGTTQQKDVVFKAIWPTSLKYQPGQTKLANPSYPSGTPLQDGISSDGVNIGTYNPGSNAFLLAEAIAVGEPCDIIEIPAEAHTKNGSIASTATITISGNACA